MEGVRSACIGIWCHNGSVNERPEEEGISHFIEHMLFKGTVNRTAFEIADEIDVMGGELNAFTGKDTTCFYVKCLDEHLLKAADVLTDMIESPLFDEQELEREKLVVIEEINMNADDPDDVSLDYLEKAVFAGCGLEHAVLGSKETVSAFDRSILKEYYDSHYTKDAIAISVSGSFDMDELENFFEGRFTNLKLEQRKDDKSRPTAEIVRKNIFRDVEQAHLAIGIPTVDCRDSNRYKLSILSTIMGGGMSSRLFQSIREQKGLAYAVYTMNGFYELGGAFVIAAGIAKDRVDEALEAIWEELDKLRDCEISEHEFVSAKEQLKSSYIFSQENVKSRMSANGRNYFALGNCPEQNEVLSMLEAITIDEVEAAKSLIVDSSKYSVINVIGKEDEA